MNNFDYQEEKVRLQNDTKMDQPPAEPWDYWEHIDEMTGEKFKTATNISTNSVNLSFPYNGGSYFSIDIMEFKWKSFVSMKVSNWQIASEYDSDARIKFDDWETFDVKYTRWRDLSQIIFDEKADLISKMKWKKKMKVEVYLNWDWPKIAEFRVEWFEW